MIRLICVALVALVVVVALQLSVFSVEAYADDYWTQELGGDHSCNYFWWITGNGPMFWRASTSGMQTDANNAFSAWRTALSNKVTFASVSSGEDVLISWSTLGNGVAGQASLTNHYYHTVRQAWYWTYAEVNLNNAICWTSTGRQGVLRHEVGHLLGRGDAYLDGGNCNPAQRTIMDGPLVTLNDPNCYAMFGHTVTGACDGINIQTLDHNLVNSYWGAGYAGNLNAVPSGSQATITWDDYCWAEGSYQLYFYKWTGSSWQYLTVYGLADNTGSHKTMIDRTISYVFTGTGPGYYKVEVKPYFPRYQQFGTTKTATFTLSQ